MKIKSLIFSLIALVLFCPHSQGNEVFQLYRVHNVQYVRDLKRKKDVVGCYYPGSDRIHLLRRGGYADKEELNQTALHELAHWARHDKRVGSFGEGRQYPEDFEDIMCEITAAVVADAMGVPRECNCRVRQMVQDYVGRRRMKKAQWNLIYREVLATTSYLLGEKYPEADLKQHFSDIGITAFS